MKYIITGDWHLKKELPRCRKDEGWLDFQMARVYEILSYAREHRAFILVTGDIFDVARPSFEVINSLIKTVEQSKEYIAFMPGNHDLLHHSFDNIDKTGYGIISKVMPEIKDYEGSFGHPITVTNLGTVPENYYDMVCTHELVFESEKDRPFPGVGQTAEELLAKYPKAHWIFCGDYHRAFHYRSADGRHVVNPGCLTIQKADYIGYQPKCVLVDTETEEVTMLDITAGDPDLFDAQYLEVKKERNGRIQAFLELVKTDKEIGLSFKDNLMTKVYQLPDGQLKDILTEIAREI